MNDKVIPFSLTEEREIVKALNVVGERYGLLCDGFNPFEPYGIGDEMHSYALSCNYFANYMLEHPKFEEASMKDGIPALPSDLGDYFVRCINGGVSLVSAHLVTDHDEEMVPEREWGIPMSFSLDHLYRYGCAASTYFAEIPHCLVDMIKDISGKEGLAERVAAVAEDYKRCCLRCLKQLSPPQGTPWPYYSRVISLTTVLIRYGIRIYRTFYGFEDNESSFWSSWDTYMPSDADV